WIDVMTHQQMPTYLSVGDVVWFRGAGEALPTETLSLNYEKVEFDYAKVRPKLTETEGVRVPGGRAGIRAGVRAIKS
ncbi:MAG: hypothetical protein RIM80_07885, partial [Alphaproteobacteria bacterium]